jgi:hypothetical protein
MTPREDLTSFAMQLLRKFHKRLNMDYETEPHLINYIKEVYDLLSVYKLSLKYDPNYFNINEFDDRLMDFCRLFEDYIFAYNEKILQYLDMKNKKRITNYCYLMHLKLSTIQALLINITEY